MSWSGDRAGDVSKVANFSEGGVFIETPKPAPAGQTLDLVLDTPGLAIRGNAVVRHSESGRGMGVEFIPHPPSDDPGKPSADNPNGKRNLEDALHVAPPVAIQQERRRYERIAATMQVVVTMKKNTGPRKKERVVTDRISPQGAGILLAAEVELGQHVAAFNPQTGAVAQCTVAFKGQRERGKRPIGLAFSAPNRGFWRVMFPPPDWAPRSADGTSDAKSGASAKKTTRDEKQAH